MTPGFSSWFDPSATPRFDQPTAPGRDSAGSPSSGRPATGRAIMHVDMDAFYASVELRRHPELKGKPVWVGGAERGVVLSANYEAKAFGVEGGMPSTRARRLCPQAVAIPPDFDAYMAASKGVFEIFGTITDTVEAMSIDEAFLDVTGSLRRLGSPVQAGELVRALVHDEQRITCSVGIAPTKFLAKLASSAAKPDGLRLIEPDAVVEFLHPLGVQKLWGVGDSTAAKLHTLGIKTVADLAYAPKATLQRAFGPRLGQLLSDLAWGRDTRKVTVTQAERSIGHQETFARDTDDVDLVIGELLRVSGTVAWRLRQSGMLARGLTLNLRFADFTQVNKSATLSSPTDLTGEIHAQAVTLFGRLGLQRARIRRVAIRAEKLVVASEAYVQPALDEPDAGWRAAERASDAVLRRFGPKAVQRASLTASRRP
ncbi:MAG: DNA polymerase IV [Propionibacteriaceae bacterium]|uniref:DNA polymerase IV n=1 Tax=Dietzia sp. UBA5065 TaxID=1946422 RepID=UPI000E9651C2|nr:DNA polymerase IV [Dietzia sp. UBA5065]MBK9157157.1 DNA polymerase IV [Micropruina sp.]HBX80281.1 DNA polymerase IV [Propionibacteriaceae bacterium]HBY22532.1 DNA polymerase IV [Propionibacteriaceae bacterium]